MSSTLENALRLAALGFYVFPLRPNGKTPLNTGWQEQSTTDPEIIKTWFENKAPNLGINCGKSGLTVVDIDEKIDPKTGVKKEGKKSAKELNTSGNFFPETFAVQSTTGGIHLFYKGSGLSNSASSFAKDIDIRGEGGYVVAPGSTLDDVPYIVVRDLPVAPLPQNIIDRCNRSLPRDKRKADVVYSEDAPMDIERARLLLKTYPEAVEGAGGDHQTYAMFCQLKDYGISQHKAVEIADEIYNPRCAPPWSIEELERIAENAYNYAHNPTGIKSIEHEFDEPQIVKPALLKRTTALWHRTICRDAQTIPKRDWIFGNIALRRQLTVLIAPGGTGKSTFTIGMGLAKAAGMDFMGMPSRGAGRVAIYNNEDALEEIERREAAMRQHYKLDKNDISDQDGTRLFYGTGDQHMFRVLKKIKEGTFKEEEDVQLAIEEIKRNKIDMFIIDPLAETHNVNENDNAEMGLVGAIYRKIAQQADCSAFIIHHTRKRDKAASDGHSGNMDSLRGASSIASLARIVVTLDTMSKSTAKKYLIKEKEDDRFKYVELMFAKANMSATTDKQFIYEKVGEKIGQCATDPDGEEVGALKFVELATVKHELREEDKMFLHQLAPHLTTEPEKIKAVALKLIKSGGFFGESKPDALVKRISRALENIKNAETPTGTIHVTYDETDGRKPALLYFVKKKSLEDIL